MPRPAKSAKHEPPEAKAAAAVTVDYGPSPEEPPAGTSHHTTPHPIDTPCQYTMPMRPVNTLCQYFLYNKYCIFI